MSPPNPEGPEGPEAPATKPRPEAGRGSAPFRSGFGLRRAMVEALKTEWKYVLIGVMILVGHFKYHLSLLYYVHELAHAQQEHVVADEQRAASAKVVKHHVDLANSLFGDGEMRGAESEFREALKVDPTNPDAQRGLFKASIFDEVDDDTNTRVASPVVILSRIRELVCEVRESQCLGLRGEDHEASGPSLRRSECETEEWRCLQRRQGPVTLTGLEGAHARLLEGMALTNVDPKASFAALREAVVLADGHAPDEGPKTGAPTNLAAAYIRIGDYYLGTADADALSKAIAAYTTALEATPWNINALDSLGYALHRAGKLDRARERFAYLGRLDDTLMIAHADLARTLRCLGAGAVAQRGLLDEAYEEQLELVSLLTAKPEPRTRDTINQWQYPVGDRVFDLHEKPAKLAYATCAVCVTGHLRGEHDGVRRCQSALDDHDLTTNQKQAVRDFLLVELDEVLGLPTGDPSIKERAAAFKAALQKRP